MRYYHIMTTKTLSRAIISKKPAIINEHGTPRFVVLDWETFKKWDEALEDASDSRRLIEALNDPKNQKRVKITNLKF